MWTFFDVLLMKIKILIFDDVFILEMVLIISRTYWPKWMKYWITSPVCWWPKIAGSWSEGCDLPISSLPREQRSGLLDPQFWMEYVSWSRSGKSWRSRWDVAICALFGQAPHVLVSLSCCPLNSNALFMDGRQWLQWCQIGRTLTILCVRLSEEGRENCTLMARQSKYWISSI